MTERANSLSPLLIVLLVGCEACGGQSPPTSPSQSVDPVELTEPPAVQYDVHEWGLVRGTVGDRVMLAGPHAEPVAMPMAKPVLYFHREGEDALELDVSVRIPHGRIVEHWPLDPRAAESSIAWRGFQLGAEACPGTRYPESHEPACASVMDGCEAAELATVETRDGDCLRDSEGEAWNHLFYRAEVTDAPELPLELQVGVDGELTVTNRGVVPIEGMLLRLRRGARYEAAVIEPPGPGQSATIPVPASPVAEAAQALSDSLTRAGLTDEEAAAFRRSWDQAFFGSTELAAGPPTASTAGETPPEARPIAGAVLLAASNSIVYVLPSHLADEMATLEFTPPPRNLRRVIVAWVDEARAP